VRSLRVNERDDAGYWEEKHVVSDAVADLRDVRLEHHGKALLRGIDWRICGGEHWAFLGANGSGKTLTLKIMTGYLWPTSGSVSVLGRSFGTIDLRELRKRIGWVSMDLQYQLQRSFTALDVVASGRFATIGLYEKPAKSIIERSRELLEFYGCGAQTDQPFKTMSYGEQKRTMIARGLVNRPDLLILDEPCTGLDLVSRERFLADIQRTAGMEGGPTIVLVTHHVKEIMPFITHCHLVKEGRTVVSGEKDSVLRNDLLSEVMGAEIELEKRGNRYYARVNGR
jgi:iron complex transport system ATP-binding protein